MVSPPAEVLRDLHGADAGRGTVQDGHEDGQVRQGIDTQDLDGAEGVRAGGEDGDAARGAFDEDPGQDVPPQGGGDHPAPEPDQAQPPHVEQDR
jgi:hypothetical protein